jgi:hypothetical protein
MSTQPPSAFFDLSALLTGFTVQTLEFAQQSADFCGVFDEIYGSGHMAKLLSVYDAHVQAGDAPNDIGKAILDAGSPVEDTARALMAFWYLGQVAPLNDPENLQIPSGNHYAQALVWRAVQAHPTGVSTQQFGYWANPPAPLNDYL